MNNIRTHWNKWLTDINKSYNSTCKKQRILSTVYYDFIKNMVNICQRSNSTIIEEETENVNYMLNSRIETIRWNTPQFELDMDFEVESVFVPYFSQNDKNYELFEELFRFIVIDEEQHTQSFSYFLTKEKYANIPQELANQLVIYSLCIKLIHIVSYWKDTSENYDLYIYDREDDVMLEIKFKYFMTTYETNEMYTPLSLSQIMEMYENGYIDIKYMYDVFKKLSYKTAHMFNDYMTLYETTQFE